jgi:hypothetical protein
MRSIGCLRPLKQVGQASVSVSAKQAEQSAWVWLALRGWVTGVIM